MRTNYPLGAKNTPFMEDREAVKRIKKHLNVHTVYLPNNLTPYVEYNATKLGLTRVAMKQKVTETYTTEELFEQKEVKRKKSDPMLKKIKTEDILKDSEETLQKLEQKFVRRSRTKMNMSLGAVVPVDKEQKEGTPKEGNTVRAHFHAVLIQMKWKSHVARRLVEAKRMAKHAKLSPRTEGLEA